MQVRPISVESVSGECRAGPRTACRRRSATASLWTLLRGFGAMYGFCQTGFVATGSGFAGLPMYSGVVGFGPVSAIGDAGTGAAPEALTESSITIPVSAAIASAATDFEAFLLVIGLPLPPAGGSFPVNPIRSIDSRPCLAPESRIYY